MPPDLRSRTVRVEPFASTGKSGSQMERWWLDDGRSVVAKHVDARDDWIMQATGDDGRVVALWAEGFFQRLPPEIAHGILEVATSERGSILVMEDLTGSVFADPAALVPAQRAVLRAAAGIHGSSREPPTTGLCSLADYYGFLSPIVTSRYTQHHEVPRLAVEGWGRFADLVPHDVSSSIGALHADVSPLSTALQARPSTFVHGDLKVANLGCRGEQVIILDWGTLSTWAPPAVDYAWYLAINGAALGRHPAELLDEISDLPDVVDEVALRLALLGATLQLGWEKALGATSDDEHVRERERRGLTWWSDQVRTALDLL